MVDGHLNLSVKYVKKILYSNITIDGNENLFSNQQVLCVYPPPGAPKKIEERVF